VKKGYNPRIIDIEGN